MTVSGPRQTVHLLNWRGLLRVLLDMRKDEGRNLRELDLYTTDNLRQLYQATDDDLIRLRDGIVTRFQLVAVIRWRIFWGRFGYALLLCMSVIAAVAGVIAAVEGRQPP